MKEVCEVNKDGIGKNREKLLLLPSLVKKPDLQKLQTQISQIGINYDSISNISENIVQKLSQSYTEKLRKYKQRQKRIEHIVQDLGD